MENHFGDPFVSAIGLVVTVLLQKANSALGIGGKRRRWSCKCSQLGKFPDPRYGNYGGLLSINEPYVSDFGWCS